MSPTCRPGQLIFSEKACRCNIQHAKRGPDTQFLCVVLPTRPTHAPEEEEEGRRLYYDILQLAIVKSHAATLELLRA
jgi:hypothetical protein